MDEASALVLFSGGQDSTTCLAWALDRSIASRRSASTIGQRHRVELDVRPRCARRWRRRFPRWGRRLGEDHGSIFRRSPQSATAR